MLRKRDTLPKEKEKKRKVEKRQEVKKGSQPG